MENQYKSYGYQITTDPGFMDRQNAITPVLKQRMEELYLKAMDGNQSDIPVFLDLIEKYPKNPQLKNYLSILYQQIGNIEKSWETNRWILKEHPDYLFGRLNLASECIDKEQYEKVPEIMGESFELKALYPERDTFHLAEITGFYKMAIHYYTSIGDLENATSRLPVLQDVAPHHPDTLEAECMVLEQQLYSKMKDLADGWASGYTVETYKNDDIKQTQQPPNFVHDELKILYEQGLYIEDTDVDTILSLPRETLIEDLERMLQDLLIRYEYYKDKEEKEGWLEETSTFPIHAIFLLGELKATESLPMILKVLSQDEEFLHFYLGDFITDCIWEPLYKLGANQLDVFKKFMFEPGVYTYVKSAISELLLQIVMHHPERRNEIVQFYRDVMRFYASSKPEDNIIDSELNGLLIGDIIDFRGTELLPEIEELYEKEMVAEGVSGNLKSVKKDIGKASPFELKKEILSIKDRYLDIVSTWAGYNETTTGDTQEDNFGDYSMGQPIVKEPKVGRNDPCPCGSGKKYKKCCLNN